MTATDIAIPEIEPLQREHLPLLQEAQAIVAIADAPTYERTAVCKRQLSARRLFVVDFFAPMKRSINHAKETILDRERMVLEPIRQAEGRLSQLLIAYDDEQERQRRLAQRQAQDAAALAEAEQHEALGDAAAAEAALNGQGLVQPVVEKATPKVEGICYREVWSAEIVDLLALVKAVAAGQAPLAYVQANQPALSQAARAIKQELNRIPGVKAVMTKTVIGRR